LRGEIMTAELQGKVGIVTGGTSGIGRDTAVLFAKAGAKVVVAGRRESEGKETIDLVRAAGGDGLFVKTTCRKPPKLRRSSGRRWRNLGAWTSRSITPESREALALSLSNPKGTGT